MRAAVAVLLGAGSGERLGAAEPKAFVDLEGATLLQWSARSARASETVGPILAVVPNGSVDRARRELNDAVVIVGGATRQASVREALRSLDGTLDGDEIVVCHDAARPFASPALFASVAAAVGDAAGAVPVVAVADTVKRVSGDRVVETVARDDLAVAQTPQAFRLGPLVDAHERAAAGGLSFTDDAALVEWAGGEVRTVRGERENIKITTGEDLALARAIARSRV
jgi:2-C-methyl-D-erythritol 4-phosphate cytidylyltransferase